MSDVRVVDVEIVEYHLAHVREHKIVVMYRRYPDGFWEKDNFDKWAAVESQDEADILEAAYQRYMADQEGVG